jgi:integrase/recombinase XerD
MSISLKLLLYKSKTYSDGKHPIMLQYIIDRKVVRKVLYKCYAEEWDSKNNRIKAKVPNSAYANNFIAEKYAAAEQDLFDLKTGATSSQNLFVQKKAMTLEHAFEKEEIRLKAEMKVGSYNKVNGFRKQLAEYTNISSLLLDHMDIYWFEKFARHLKNLGNNGETAQKKVKTIRAIVIRYADTAISADLRKFRLATKKAIKQKLTPTEVSNIIGLDLDEGSLIAATRDLFILQVYLRGVRVGDILQASADQFQQGVFTYTDDKTGKTTSMKIIPPAQAIIDRYTGKHQRLFPFFKWTANRKLDKFQNKAARMVEKGICTAVVNKYLKQIAKMAGIEKPLSSHIARHTFARMAIDKINNPMITMELLGHSSLAIHQGYLNDLRKDDVLDQAADDIFGL